MKFIMKKNRYLIPAFMLFFLIGCAGRSSTESFLRTEVDLGYIEKVAVLPFENYSTEPLSAQRSRELVITQVLASGMFDIIDKGYVDSVLRTEAISAGVPIDPLTLRRLGERLGAQGFILGSVDYAGMGQAGNAAYPELSLTLRLVDSESGFVIWQASGRGSGYSVWERLFGVSPKDEFQVTLKLIRRLLATMRK
jgi:TolB-like protein